MMLKCTVCGTVARQKGASFLCPKCGNKSLEPYKNIPAKQEPISVDTMFKGKAENSKIRVNEETI